MDSGLGYHYKNVSSRAPFQPLQKSMAIGIVVILKFIRQARLDSFGWWKYIPVLQAMYVDWKRVEGVIII